MKVVHNGADAIEYIVNNLPIITLMDYRLPDMTAKQIVEALADQKIEFPFLVMTGHGDEKVAVEMMKVGARDYIVKQGQFFELLPSVIKWVFKELESEKKLVQANEALEESEKNTDLLWTMPLSESTNQIPMVTLYTQIMRWQICLNIRHQRK